MARFGLNWNFLLASPSLPCTFKFFMSRALRFIALFAAAAARIAFAETGLPTLQRSPSGVSLSASKASATFDLRDYFAIPGIPATVAQFNTTSGIINVELLSADAPRHVANFTTYVNAGAYTNTIIHRSAALSGTAKAIIQGGGYTASIPLGNVAANPPIALEYKVANARGTLAAARTSDINSATSEWYFNVQDNSTILGPQNGGGYSVFGRVIGTGLSVVDSLAAIPTYSVNPFSDLPLRNIQSGQTSILVSNLVLVNSIRIVPHFPSYEGEAAIATFAAVSDNPSVAVVSVSGSSLTVTGLLDGTAHITIRAVDGNANAAQVTLDVTVAGLLATAAPSFVASPRSVALPPGGIAALTAAATGVPAPTYQWYRNGVALQGATRSQLIITGLAASHVGEYTVVAANSSGSATSDAARIDLATSGSSSLGNISVRAAMSADNPLIVGFSSSGDKTILIRGVGPGLAKYGVGNFFADPRLELYRAVGMGSVLASQNEDWPASLAPIFSQVYAFDLTPGSKDTALQYTISGAYTAQLKGTGNGIVLVEAYDAGPSQSTRLGNVSARYVSGSGDKVLIAGFTIGGTTAKTLLIRGVGPKLADYGVSGVLEDPKLSLFAQSTLIAENDNWDASISSISDSTGAFALTAGSKDAAFLITLPPGTYTAQVSGPAPGEALVEVYELP